MWMIAYIIVNIKEGISKKVLFQAQALSILKEKCILFCLNDNDSVIKITYENGSLKKQEIILTFNSSNKTKRLKSFIGVIKEQLDDECKSIYIRHMIPTFELIKFLTRFKKNKIFYEIPTYPYFFEQFSVSNNKIKTIFRLSYELIFWPLIYSKITKLVVIPCRDNIHVFKKMQLICNGCTNTPVCIEPNLAKNNKLNMIGVGTIQKYHGYDKIIKAMANYDGPLQLHFVVVGNGDIKYLEDLVNKNNLEDKVEFKGLLKGKELENEYTKANLGIGTMALEFRKANIDTGIKILEYYGMGLLVLSSGNCPKIEDLNFTPYLIMGDTIDFDYIYKWISSFDINERKKLAYESQKYFSWTNILKKVI